VVAVLIGRAPYYAMAPEERALIEPPLARLLARLPAERAERLGRMADPVMILAGLGLYARRVATLKAAEVAVAPITNSPAPEMRNGTAPMPEPDTTPGIVPDSIRSAFPEP